MPKLSPSMTRATVTKWLKAEGDEINEYDAILELSTDSLYAPGDAPVEGSTVDMVVELAECGFVGKLFVAEGDTVEVGQAVMAMCEEEENVRALSGATSPSVDCYSGAGEGFRIATYQGYLNHKTE
ncbi:pyruvate dehydrogenase E1 component subunit beta [Ectocarpus siliculosus]|uniref:Pyruvate dehydrogenase E1 component subunit beta n=1 Tax=Ectocarpus siliculosus TaxID=2880 RepID=D7FRP6_ECTSI|nr:pyruvate dehydrogenase E1 component subunit beta [Ectocarpus siliculosus]|eukprot:CBJ30837.1 pyruvate dehydrogenase E1 component subunit beta [Ectocarpus siliculosus]